MAVCLKILLLSVSSVNRKPEIMFIKGVIYLSAMSTYWQGKRVLITGGLGFIGSTLAIRLVHLDAHVTIVDAMIPFLGGNEFNIAPIRDNPLLRINISNIYDRESMEHLVKDKDHIFHLASQVSHVLGQTDPLPDIHYNILGTTTLLEACKKNNPSVKILYTGTRGQYGPAMRNPIPEEASLSPLGLHEITKVAAEQILAQYPQLTRDGLAAAFRYAADVLKGEHVWDLKTTA